MNKFIKAIVGILLISTATCLYSCIGDNSVDTEYSDVFFETTNDVQSTQPDNFLNSLSDIEKADYFYNKQNYTEAFRLYKKVADTGDGYAMYMVGVCYMWGYGVEKCEATANKWLTKASNYGYEEGDV